MSTICNGIRPQYAYPDRRVTRCTITNTANTNLGNCQGLAGRLNTAALRRRCRTHGEHQRICGDCVAAARNQLTAEEATTYRDRLRDLCIKCQRYEAGRHPNGFTGCICTRNLSRQPQYDTKCYVCRRTGVDDAVDRIARTDVWYLCIGRDRQGRFVYGYHAYGNRNHDPCPACGRLIPKNWDLRTLASTVTFCAACHGINVIPTTGPNWRRSRVAPVRAVRFSRRIVARNAALPALDFFAIGQPGRLL